MKIGRKHLLAAIAAVGVGALAFLAAGCGGGGGGGSANTEISNGGTMAALARFIMSRASIARLPPMNMPVRFTPSGPREKIASCTSPVTSSSVTEV